MPCVSPTQSVPGQFAHDGSRCHFFKRGVGPLERTASEWAPCFRLSFAAAGAYCRIMKSAAKFRFAGDRAGFEDARKLAKRRWRELIACANLIRDRIPYCGKGASNRIGSAADFEIATREVAGAGEVDFGEASIRHGEFLVLPLSAGSGKYLTGWRRAVHDLKCLRCELDGLFRAMKFVAAISVLPCRLPLSVGHHRGAQRQPVAAGRRRGCVSRTFVKFGCLSHEP